MVERLASFRWRESVQAIESVMEEIEDLDVTLNESILESLRGKKLKSTKVRTRPV